MTIDPQYITLLISAIGVLISFIVSNRNSKNADISEAITNTKEMTKISTKLDGIAQDVRDTGKLVDKLNDTITEQGKEIVWIKEQVNSAHTRIDDLVHHFNHCCDENHQYKEKIHEK